ncbi:MAG: GNAT family N-acetyltransferase [Maribacter sp.]|nr:GNAT family N-acetyltransferase [Maribacter sp.]
MVTYKVISEHKGMVEGVVVYEIIQGKGIGRKLMENAYFRKSKNKPIGNTVI